MEAKKEESWKQKLPTKSKEYRNGGTLRDYQIEGTVVIFTAFLLHPVSVYSKLYVSAAWLPFQLICTTYSLRYSFPLYLL